MMVAPKDVFYLYALCWLSLAGCVEVVDINTAGSIALIAISGQINNSTAHDQRIRVSRTTSDFERPEDIPDAKVQVVTDDGIVHDYYFSTDKGHYLPVTAYVGVPGTSYQLQVQIGPRQFRSNFQTMPLFTAVDSSYYEVVRTEINTPSGTIREAWFLELWTDSQIPAEADTLFIKRDVIQAYAHAEVDLPVSVFPGHSPKNCWISQVWIGPDIMLFDGATLPTKTIPRQLMAREALDNSFVTLRGYGVVQSSFSEEALHYWQRINDVSNRDGSLFEVPPAAVPGNIKNVETIEDYALGFFEVAKVDTTGILVLAEDLPIFLGLNGNFVDCRNVPYFEIQQLPRNCLECLEDTGLDPACYDCLVLENSSVNKPAFLDF